LALKLALRIFLEKFEVKVPAEIRLPQ
jgi:hypothetical protein